MRSNLDILDLCRNCGAGTYICGYGVVAPWIREKCKLEEVETKLLKCTSCGFHFFSRGFSEAEMNNLYSDYRSSNYWKIRKKWEPWLFFSNVDTLKDKNSESTRLRKKFLENAFETSGVALDSLMGVIDYGGDLGQFIPTQVNGPKVVVDPSTVKNYKFDDVQFVVNIKHYTGPKVDLIMCCHVIEHLVDFKNVLKESLEYLSDSGYLYIEVPTDSFVLGSFHKATFSRIYINFIYRIPPIFMTIDFLTGLFRLFFDKIPFFGSIKQSEHINYFSEKSLIALAKELNMEMLSYSKDSGLRQGKLRIGSQSILLKIRNS